MRRILKIETGILFAALLFLGFLAPWVQAAPVLENANCPISGDPVNPQVTTVYQGKTYGFCCAGCVKKFKKNPEEYIAAMHGEHGTKEHAGHSHG